MSEIYRNEYPRPQFQRNEWISLNGKWDFSFDSKAFDKEINVPFVYQSDLSGINVNEFHEKVYYRKKFAIPDEWRNKKILLNFGAVDYECTIWINNNKAFRHTGGQIGFSFDISKYINKDINVIEVDVLDYPKDLDILRGKQYWKEKSENIWYTSTTGIWQSVWIEAVEEEYLKNVFITPFLDEKAVRFDYELSTKKEVLVEAKITYENKIVAKSSINLNNGKGTQIINFSSTEDIFYDDIAWTPENPRLFEVQFSIIKENLIKDIVNSYFGFRKISIDKNGTICLNNRPYFQRLVLDQGYWPEGILTAPSDKDYIKDIKYIKEMGFNGVRKHQKVEDPRFLYHADKMGLLVWGEIGSGYKYSNRLVEYMTNEWQEAIKRDYNHPCIVAWTPLNESWGINEISTSEKQQHFTKAISNLTKALDSTRPVIDNDGWEHIGTDYLTIHDYEHREEVLEERYTDIEKILKFYPGKRSLYVGDGKYNNEPIIVSEFGGISYITDKTKGWGYSNAESEEDFLKRYEAVITPLVKSKIVQGFCYTQITDVEQEVNGLLTYDRKPKANIEKIRKITMKEK